ncbi:MAG: hypothetical protein M3Q08_10960, partial [Pseudomonadota bacterium]|nr:hypothetical protein [Pseudomonadota bacterium]
LRRLVMHSGVYASIPSIYERRVRIACKEHRQQILSLLARSGNSHQLWVFGPFDIRLLLPPHSDPSPETLS